VIVVLSIILPMISLYLFSRYEITRTQHESNLGVLGYTTTEEPGGDLTRDARPPPA
jgi:hypothetical protein